MSCFDALADFSPTPRGQGREVGTADQAPPRHSDEAGYLRAGAARDVWESLFLVVVEQSAWFGLLFERY
jgi:hypothetical protein